MKNKRLKLSATFLLGLGLTGLQAQTMYVKESNGTHTSYALIDIRKLTFSDGNLTVSTTDNSNDEYALNALRYLNFIEITTDLEEQEGAEIQSIHTYPNPVTDELKIDLTGTGNVTGSLSILSLEGKLLQEQKTTGASIVTLNLSQLPQGIYLCRYADATEIKTVKIIKQ